MEDLTRVQSATRHLLGLINGILDLSKIEAGKMDLDLQTFDVKSMIDELVGTIDAVVRKNGNRLSVTCADSLGTMRADAMKVRQILFTIEQCGQVHERRTGCAPGPENRG